MRSEETLLTTYHQCNDRAIERTIQLSAFLLFFYLLRYTYLPIGGLPKLSCIFLFTWSEYEALVDFGLTTRPSRVLKERLNILSKLTIRFRFWIV